MAGLRHAAAAQCILDGVPDFRFQLHTVEAVDLLDAGRRNPIDAI
jgi:hypothetical protein